ncbi:MAG: OmpH family outer membrane protein [Bacteroidaceae bacterium]|nr:OmpH family outer membrane protein [Bacteroidaceae bacterium]MBR1791965.1 OmpH family outer membrane protein [Bacteroidaceae bacterium]
MSKHFIAILLALFLPLLGGTGAFSTLRAQDTPEVRVAQFGYLSYNDIFQRMPEYAEAQASFAQLKAKYDAEAQRAEDEFQRKFAEFLQGQKDFPASIMQKRQMELQDLMDKSVAFRQETQRLLKQAEAELQAPVAAKLNEAIQAVAGERGLTFVLNTDNNAVPFIHPQVGVNITEPVLIRLGLASTISD